MRIIRLDRDEFVAKVQENRDRHRLVFEKALEAYRDRWIQELERRLHDLWVGGDLETKRPSLAAVQLAELESLGVTHIVDCRIEWNDVDWVTEASPRMRYEWLGVDDAGQRMPDEWFARGTSFVRTSMAAGGVVLAHCHMGINRGPSMGFAVMLELGWDPIEALDRIRVRRSIAHIAYAEDAYDWWCVQNGVSEVDRKRGHGSIRQWRRDNHLDVAHVIRMVRLGEGA